MPRYFTDLQINELVISDDEGSHVASLSHARNEAVEALRVAIADQVRHGDQCEFSATVRDEHGRTLYRARLAFTGSFGPDRVH